MQKKEDPEERYEDTLYLEEDSSELLLDDYQDIELEMLKSTRDNFLAWKDYEY